MKQSIYLKSSLNKINRIELVRFLRKAGATIVDNKLEHKIVIDYPKRLVRKILPAAEHLLSVIPHGRGKHARKRLLGLLPTAKPLTPIQVAKAYNYPLLDDCSEQCIAFLELGGFITPTIVDEYCAKLGVKPATLTVFEVDGDEPESDGPDGADGEVALDVCVVAAICPGIKILIVFAPNTDQGFIDGVIAATNHPLNPSAISISWGSPEIYWTADVRTTMDAAIQAANVKGINVFVAAGDNGSDDGVGDRQPHVDYPASSPFAIGCGGTKLTVNADGSRNSEVVWQTNGATGGGISAAYPGRQVPDVSGNASPDSGYIIDDDSEITAIGGTSGVAPLYAALTALIRQHTGQTSSFPHFNQALGDLTFDVVKGNNGAYKAGPGYDRCTGWGVVDGTKLLNYIRPQAIQKQSSKWRGFWKWAWGIRTEA